MNASTTIVVGTVVERGGKFLLVQEAQERCRGKWNLPAGRLDPNETVFEGAIRETKEETGCDVELVNVCQIGNRVTEDNAFISVIFTAKLLQETIKINPAEILDVKWFSYEEILAMRSEIRSEEMLIKAIENHRNGLTAPLEIVNQY